MKTAEKIRKFRKEQHLTQIQLAQKAGIAVNTLRLYEGGKRPPNPKLLQYLADALNVPIATLSDSISESEPCHALQPKSTALYPTEKGCAILCMTMEDDSVHIMPDYPMIPILKQIPERISEKDMEDLEELLRPYYNKHDGIFPPEIGAGVKLMLDLLAKKTSDA